MSEQEALVTNERYLNHDVVWGRPKGLLYGNFPGTAVEQKANLYPDMAATYNVANFCLPRGGSLILAGEYPHARYLSFTIANQLGGGQFGNGTYLRGDQIAPDPGSSNPFLSSVGRDVTNRRFTIFVVQGKAPKKRPAQNTLYTGTDSERERIHLSIRTYLADRGYDGTGNVKIDGAGFGLPAVTLALEGRKKVSGPDLLQLLRVQKDGDPNGYTIGQWLFNVKSAGDSVNAPCLPEPTFQLFWNTDYSVTGAFHALHPRERVINYPPSTAGGFANNPDTCYMIAPISFGFGEVVVVRGKMPTHPRTRSGETTLPEDPQVQYFSVSTAAAPCSGQGWDTVCDEQIPVDKNGYYHVVVSNPWNRPTNALRENGVVWLNPGIGEGYYIGARSWVGCIYIRYQNTSSNWVESPANIPMPTEEEPIPQDPFIMREYFPVAKYMSKAKFERKSLFQRRK
eukprot:CAMPEP_0201482696 /NCGR_PEP_ID=MMETSP0151_2-20130828/6957_1 /ASSEMBLY_ACC=CAM_ASM_000257 /TAXON_ID=200890 /ORGANISM="Paramoeba atlantica, Strain 621/1 / CCAP 1560/9" /LENGTH=453 /DNA_ID=CAMNT_0047865507 /DNA_START=227 /DNA_END=1588 /DNA_ORIENTATION=-